MGYYAYGGRYVADGATSDYFDTKTPSYRNRCDGVFATGKFLRDYGNGDVIDGDAHQNVTLHFIPVTEGEQISVMRPTKYEQNADVIHATEFDKTGFRIVFYRNDSDQTGSFISCVGNSTEFTTVPVGAKYCRVSKYVPYGDFTGLFVGIGEYEPYYKRGDVVSAYIKDENRGIADRDRFYGKRWVLFGDSLTDSCGGHDWLESHSNVGGDGWKESASSVPWDGFFWATGIARKHGLYLDNRGKIGSNMCVSTDAYASVSGIYQLDAFVAEIDAGAEQPEIITVGFGSNCYSEYVGNAGDASSTNRLSYYGATRYFIEKLREKCPLSELAFIIPPPCNWEGTTPSKVTGVPLARTAIKTVCDEYNVKYVDMEHGSGITLDMLPDGVHIFSKEANKAYERTLERALF